MTSIAAGGGAIGSQYFLKPVHCNWLYHVSIKSRLARVLAVCDLTVTRQGHEVHATRIGQRTQVLRRFVAIHLWKANIEQPHIGSELFDKRKGQTSPEIFRSARPQPQRTKAHVRFSTRSEPR